MKRIFLLTFAVLAAMLAASAHSAGSHRAAGSGGTIVAAAADSSSDSTALSPLQRLAERLTRFGNSIPQEKVFVHLDNTGYRLGDTIWFAAYTRNTSTDAPSHISRVLYAELWNHDGYLVERKLVEMRDGRGHSFFALADTLYAGYYELRAYTRWQLNWGQTEHYHVPYSEYWFYNRAMAKDFFRDYDKLYSRVFPVFDKPVDPADTFNDMTLRPLRRYFKSSPKAAELRLSLFPEGGSLVAGAACRVAFEAATSEGEVRQGRVELFLDGTRQALTDDSGRTVDHVVTEDRGRGTFVFTPERGKRYEVRFTAGAADASGAAPTVATPLHAPSETDGAAVALQVRHDSAGATWHIGIATDSEGARQPIGMTVMHEGRVERFEEIAPAQAGATHASFAIAEGDLRTGVNQVTVFDTLGRVLADRLFFVRGTQPATPQLAITGLKPRYAPYEAVSLDVRRQPAAAAAAADTTQAVISLAVRDASQTTPTFDSGNILTEMLLASEVKGFVPRPEYFFEADDAHHRRALDLLMLTQGWRRFDWRSGAVKGAWHLTHPAEHTQIVSGTVNQYYAHVEGFNPNLDVAMAEHEAFMRAIDTPLSEQDTPHHSDTQNVASGASTAIGNRSYGWNINPDAQREEGFATQATSHRSAYQPEATPWSNNDYNILSYRTADDYRATKRSKAHAATTRYAEEGSAGKEVRVHAEFANLSDPKDYITGDDVTRHGRFQIDLPRFNGYCMFFLAASDTTRWKKGQRHEWVKVDRTDEYSHMPEYPEYYVRLNWAYPRWVKPYTFYQVRTPAQATNPTPTAAGGHLLAAQEGDVFRRAHGRQQAYTPQEEGGMSGGTTGGLETTLDEVTVRARRNGLRRIDYSKPAYVIDALEAMNLCMDAGLIDYTFSAYDVARSLARLLVSDMGMERHYDVTVSEDSEPGKFRAPMEQRRYQLLTFIDQLYVYTDYSPRREGDERYAQDNQPEVRIDIRRLPNDGQRLTYVDRRLILNGFAYEEHFYNPDYRRTPPTEATADYRRTLYWNPDLQLDADGHANVTFFTGTRPATLSVDAQGQAAGGTLLFNTPQQQ